MEKAKILEIGIEVKAYNLDPIMGKFLHFVDIDNDSLNLIFVVPKKSDIIQHFRKKNVSARFVIPSAGFSTDHEDYAKAIKDAFDSGVPMELKMKKEYRCQFRNTFQSCKDCRLVMTPIERTIELHTKYKTCEVEKVSKDGHYRIDVKFIPIDDNDKELWLEIWYSHETRGIKVLQSFPIIEVDIRDGGAAEKIRTSKKIVLQDSKKVTFMNPELLPVGFEGAFCEKRSALITQLKEKIGEIEAKHAKKAKYKEELKSKGISDDEINPTTFEDEKELDAFLDNTELEFGKHKGMSLTDAYEIDPTYFSQYLVGRKLIYQLLFITREMVDRLEKNMKKRQIIK